MNRPCECRRARTELYTVDQCWFCWLALNTKEYGPSWGGVMPENPLPICGPNDSESATVEPVPRDKWPSWASWLESFRNEGDKGVGDTVERKLGLGGRVFKASFDALGIDCGCVNRQALWNTLYPYQ